MRGALLATPRQQQAARALFAAVARGEIVTDVSFITERLATGGAVDTVADVKTVVAAGIDTLIDCRAEFAQAADFGAYLAGAWPQLTYCSCPTVDDGMPKDAAWFAPGIAAALTALERPQSRVLAYCSLGINRGPSMAYAILRALGYAGDDAFDLLIAKRPLVGVAYRADADAAVARLGYC